MSLAQHVTQQQGFDYEGPANLSYSSHHDGDGEDKGDDADSEASSRYTETDTCKGDFSVIVLHAPAAETSRPEWRHMNFDPAEPAKEAPHIAAYKVSDAKRLCRSLLPLLLLAA